MKEYANPLKGMNTDNNSLNMGENSYSFAMNAMLESTVGDGFLLQNDYSNLLGAVFQEGENIIGKKYLDELDVLILFTTNNRILALSSKLYDDRRLNLEDVNGGSVPLEPDNSQQILEVREIASSPCFNFSIKHKLDVEHKITDSTINLYFVDGGWNENRYIYFNKDFTINESFREIIGYNNASPIYGDNIDCNTLKFNPETSYPYITNSETEGGNLLAGTYQFLIAYSTSKGIPLTKYKGATNPFSLFTKSLTVETNYNTGKGIRVDIDNIDVTGRWRWVNIAVASTINGVTTYSKITTLPVAPTISYTYTGDSKAISIQEEELFQIYPFYRSANNIAKANNKLFMTGLKDYEKYNLQPVINQLKLKWFTITAKEGGFKNPEFSQQYRQYMRDEVYSFGLKFILDNGEETQVFSLIGREATSFDREILKTESDDCGNIKEIQRWQEYNTATITSTTSSEYNKCDYKQYQEGEFAYWESTDLYPADPLVWEELANTPIRHFKMPDCLVSPISNGNELNPVIFTEDNFIYPLGVKVDGDVDFLLQQAVSSSLITQSQKDRIRGYKVVRGNRVGNESVIAKGWVSDVNTYLENAKPVLYPNYGFNDVRRDPYLLVQDASSLSSEDAARESYNIEYFPTNRYTFHSPDTSFTQPSLGTTLKVENEIYGTSNGFFSKSKGQAEYVILGRLHYNFAIVTAWLLTKDLKLSESSDPGSQGQAIGGQIGGLVGGIVGTVAGGNTVAGSAIGSGVGSVIGRLIGGMTKNDSFNAMYRLNMWISQTDRILELLQNTIPLQNYHWQYQAVGKYTNSVSVPNNIGKNHKILHSSYLNRGRQIVGVNDKFNNNKRESSVYLHLDGNLPDRKHQDVSKFTSSIDGACVDENQEILANISSFYTSIKREISNQYSNIFAIDWIPVSGKMWKIEEKAEEFGGDKFIGRFAFKRVHNFFTNTSYNFPDRTDIYYEDYSNIGFPLYFFNTKYTGARDDVSTTMKFLEGITNATPVLAALNNIESPQVITNGGIDMASYQVTGVQDALASLFGRTFLNPYVTNKPARFYLNCRQDKFYEKLDDYLVVPNSGGWLKDRLPFSETGIATASIKNVRFDFSGIQGRIYTYYYAIPSFLCESDVNLDLRHAEDPNEKDFYPRQSDLSVWLQNEGEYTPNEYDNYYSYNRSYSKQNKEDISLKTDVNFSKDKDKIYYENRGIYSQDGAEVENSNLRDNYLFFKPLDAFDFTYENGKLISVDSIESEQVLFRFENNLRIINAFNTIQTDGTSIELGSGSLFGARPQEFSKSDTGYIGTQHTDILNTEFGHITVDAKRGNVFNLQVGGKGVEELAKGGMRNWMHENLPFKILKWFPDVDVDNSYNGIGLSLSYDKRWKRFFITKLDYTPLVEGIVHKDGEFFHNNKKISLRDSEYFCNASFTISYNFYSKTWVSFHSFTPNYYIDGISLFYSGLNGLNDGLSSLWIHNLTNKSYQTYYTKLFPFIVEATSNPSVSNKLITDVSFLLDVVRSHNSYDRSYIDNITFNKAEVYNDRQHSGILHLNLLNPDDLSQSVSYPSKQALFTDIAIKKNENVFSFNQFTDLSKNNNLPKFLNTCNNVNKLVNLNAINYQDISVNNNYIRGEKVFVKLTNDIHSAYKFIFKGIITNQIASIR